MIEKIKELYAKHKEIIVYVIFGVLTTAVDFATYILLTRLFSMNEDASNVIAQIVAIIFAFFTNKSWVFKDTVSGKGAVLAQFGKFTLSRVSTYFVEWGLGAFVPMILIACGFEPFRLIITVDADMIATAVSVVLVTVLNYILSKLLVFTKKK